VYLDAPTPYLDIRHTTTFVSSGQATHSSDLKSLAAYRSIPLPNQLLEALRRRSGKKDSLFVVPSETTGNEMSLSAFRRMWGIVKRAVDFHVEPHLLRHTYITELCASGMDIKKIQYLAGHATVQMTLNIYAKVTNNQPGELAPDIILAFSGTPTGTLDAK
jgi:integrase